MLTLRTFFVAALLGLCLSIVPVQAAEPPTRSDVQQSLDKIADRKLADADQKILQQSRLHGSVLKSCLNRHGLHLQSFRI